MKRMIATGVQDFESLRVSKNFFRVLTLRAKPPQSIC